MRLSGRLLQLTRHSHPSCCARSGSRRFRALCNRRHGRCLCVCSRAMTSSLRQQASSCTLLPACCFSFSLRSELPSPPASLMIGWTIASTLTRTRGQIDLTSWRRVGVCVGTTKRWRDRMQAPCRACACTRACGLRLRLRCSGDSGSRLGRSTFASASH